MKRYFYVLFLFLFLGSVKTNAQNVFDPNDPDSIFTASFRPPTPPWGPMAKWGHSNANLGWNPFAAGFKSYFFKGTAFRLKYPKTLAPGVADGKKYPVYIFLHGAGEPGDYWDNELHLIHGARLHAQKVDEGVFDGFLLYAQSQSAYHDGLVNKIKEIVDSLAKHVKADIDRVIVGGLSSGGSGTLAFLQSSPQSWAAVTPISSSSLNVNNVPNLLSIPIWISNGGQDNNPPPSAVAAIVNKYQELGGDVRHSFFPNLAHNVWNNFWSEPGYFDFLANAHKAQPVVKFQRTEWCPDDVIRSVMILQPGFYAYEWQKDGVTIPGADRDSLVATEFGSYRARFKRTAAAPWSEWSPRPVQIAPKAVTVTPPITVKGLRTAVLPAPDGSSTVPLMVPTGYATYEWRRVSDNALLSDSNVLMAPVGQYKVRVMEQYGCSSTFSDVFTVVSATGPNAPEKATNVSAEVLSTTSIEVYWTDNPSPAHNETAYEVYRSTSQGTNYELVGVVPADTVRFLDDDLEPNTMYYYIVRAINGTAASALSNEVSVKTFSDVTPPSVPAGLQVVAVTRHSVSLSWNASTDDVGVKNYEVYVNGRKAFVTEKTEFDINGLDSFTTHSFYVKAVDVAGNISGASSQVTAFTRIDGLNYTIYEGSWDQLPDFTQLTPAKRGYHPNINLSVSPYTDDYGMLWEGWIRIPSAGTYTFYLTSDDGSAMFLDQHYSPGATRFINNDGAHAAQTVSKTATLSAGWHKLAVVYFQKSGGASLTLEWKLPGLFQSKQAIADTYFRDATNPPTGVPAKPTNLAATALSYDLVKLTWEDKSTNETGFEIYRRSGSDPDFTIISRTAANVTEFVDSTVAGSVSYTYRMQAVNDNGVSGYTPNVAVTTPNAPPIPAAPQITSVTALSATAAEISMSASGHTGYEVYRSISNDSEFRKFATVDTTSATFSITDSTLFAHTMVYYKVKATGVAGTSDFSAVDSVMTPNTVPVIIPLNSRFIYYAGSSVIPVKVIDPDGDNLTFTFTNLPSFATFEQTGRTTGTLQFNTQPVHAGIYNITVTVDDGFGGIASEVLKLVVNDNRPPAMGRLRAIVINEGETTSVAVSAIDPDRRDNLDYSVANPPSFITGRQQGNSYLITASPDFGDAGDHEFMMFVTDGNGGLDSMKVVITVSKVNPNSRIYINVQNTTPAPAAPWNNITASATTALKNDKGEVSAVGITFTPDNWNTSSLGTETGNNSGVYPDAVMRDNYYFGLSFLPDTVSFTLSGLDANTKYRLNVFASSSYSGGTTVFETANQTRSIDVDHNVSKKAHFGNLLSDANGTITVKMSKGAETPIGYINAIVLEKAYDDGTAPKAPANLTATLLADGSVQLSWMNRAYNADGYTVLRATSASGAYTPLTGEIDPDDSTFVDNGVQSNTDYFYKLFAYNHIGNSDTIGVATVHTSNRLPELETIDHVYLKTGASHTIHIEATDTPGEILTLDVTGLPSFATFTPTGNGTGTIHIQPGDQMGLYEGITVTVTDPEGATASQTFNVSVADASTRTVKINFGSTEPAPWNNYNAPPNPYFTLTNIVDDVNAPTPFTFKFTTVLSGKSTFGMGDGNDGLYADSVLIAAMFVNNENTHTMEFAGLDPSKTYNLGIFSSFNSGLPDSATFTSGGKSIGVNGRYNTNKNAYLNALTPTPAGLIQVNLVKHGSSGNFLLNALKLEEYNSVDLVRPIDLVAEPLVSNRSVRLKWSDRSDSETGYEVYRSISPSGGFTLVTTTAANVTTYDDKTTTLVPGQVYYYRVRAKKGTTYSAYSNLARFVLAKNLVLLNMNIPGFEQAAPWNNTSNPTSAEGTGVANLINTESINTGIDFAITRGFNGKGFEGVNGSGILPVLVMRSNYWTDAGQVSSAKFSGLDLRQTYRVGIFNSVQEVTGRYFGIYTVNGVTKSIDGQSNNVKMLYFNNVRPDENGEIHISVTPDTRYSPYCFTNAFTLEGYMDPEDDLGQGMNFGNDAGLETIRLATQSAPQPSALSPDPIRLIDLRAYPNPFVSALHVEVDIPANTQKAVVELFDLHSRLVLRKEINDMSSNGGRRTLALPVTEQLAPGMYTLKLTAGDQFKTVKLVKSN